METLDQIKQQLAELTAKVDELGKTEANAYSFTEDEIVQFVQKLHESFTTSLERCSRRNDYGEAVELELYGREIEVNIDGDQIASIIIDGIDFSNDEDDIIMTVNNIVNEIKNNQ
jgi:hypothetical protein